MAAAHAMKTLLLTGVPRSGTTLTGALLNRLPDVLAISESIVFGGLDTRPEALRTISGFVQGVREAALRDGIAPTKTDGDWTSDNFVGPPKTDGGIRPRAGSVQALPIGKALSPDFLLCIKQPALFTALAEELSQQYPLAAIIRSPLAVLASWQTVDFHIQDGRMPQAERLDPDLAARLASIGDRLDRQVELIAWFLATYAKLPEKRVFRYEDLVLDPRSQLRPMIEASRPVLQAAAHEIKQQAPEDRYPGLDFPELARRLQRIEPLIEDFYPGYGQTLAEAIDDRRASLRYRGADGEGGKVNLFVAGVAKGGTTALATYLGRHPAIRIANRKEMHLFDKDEWYAEIGDFERYHVWFRPPVRAAKVIAEATPAYFLWPKALERLKAYNPDARFVVVLRHPTFRAYSQWRMERARGRETLDFSAAIRAEASRRLSMRPDRVLRRFAYAEWGRYGTHIEHLLSLFPRDQCHFLRTDALWTAPDAELRAIHEFLRIEPLGLGQAAVYESPTLGVEAAPISPQDRAYLDGLLRDEIIKAQELTGLDLGDWLGADYAEPMRQPAESVEV